MNILNAKNIGPTIGKRLNELGIFTLADLAEVTPVKAYQTLTKNYPNKTFPICYYLYSLEGALVDLHWDDLPQTEKNRLLKEAQGI